MTAKLVFTEPWDDLLKAAKAVLPIITALSIQCGLGENQKKRVATLRAIIKQIEDDQKC